MGGPCFQQFLQLPEVLADGGADPPRTHSLQQRVVPGLKLPAVIQAGPDGRGLELVPHREHRRRSRRRRDLDRAARNEVSDLVVLLIGLADLMEHGSEPDWPARPLLHVDDVIVPLGDILEIDEELKDLSWRTAYIDLNGELDHL